MSLWFPVPWRRFVVETILTPEQAHSSITRRIAGKRIRKFSSSVAGFRFRRPLENGRTWLTVFGVIQPSGSGSRVGVRIRAALPEIVMLGVSALFVPTILVATMVHRHPLDAFNRYLVFGLAIGPAAWLLLSLQHAVRAREVEKWLRSALPLVSVESGKLPTYSMRLTAVRGSVDTPAASLRPGGGLRWRMIDRGGLWVLGLLSVVAGCGGSRLTGSGNDASTDHAIVTQRLDRLWRSIL